ncbi:hypothetical protein [Streptomyces sp. CAU 1734]|uniref:hypothetical protein n=1 Tax=Streptomyces sp. CAU 1734 TaxID=3140360 RepID=UPI0032612937
MDEIRFDGPHTGKAPGPNQDRGCRSYCPASLRDAPAWVRNLADDHGVPDPLAAGQRP